MFYESQLVSATPCSWSEVTSQQLAKAEKHRWDGWSNAPRLHKPTKINGQGEHHGMFCSVVALESWMVRKREVSRMLVDIRLKSTQRPPLPKRCSMLPLVEGLNQRAKLLIKLTATKKLKKKDSSWVQSFSAPPTPRLLYLLLIYLCWQFIVLSLSLSIYPPLSFRGDQVQIRKERDRERKRKRGREIHVVTKTGTGAQITSMWTQGLFQHVKALLWSCLWWMTLRR